VALATPYCHQEATVSLTYHRLVVAPMPNLYASLTNVSLSAGRPSVGDVLAGIKLSPARPDWLPVPLMITDMKSP
jgi:hypothetical protein